MNFYINETDNFLGSTAFKSYEKRWLFVVRFSIVNYHYRFLLLSTITNFFFCFFTFFHSSFLSLYIFIYLFISFFFSLFLLYLLMFSHISFLSTRFYSLSPFSSSLLFFSFLFSSINSSHLHPLQR